MVKSVIVTTSNYALWGCKPHGFDCKVAERTGIWISCNFVNYPNRLQQTVTTKSLQLKKYLLSGKHKTLARSLKLYSPNKNISLVPRMVSYRAGYQPLNHPATPFSTSRKVLQRYDLFLKPPNFSRKKSGGLALKSVRFTGQNHGSYASLCETTDNGQQTTDNGQRTTDNRQWSYDSYSVCET